MLADAIVKLVQRPRYAAALVQVAGLIVIFGAGFPPLTISIVAGEFVVAEADHIHGPNNGNSDKVGCHQAEVLR